MNLEREDKSFIGSGLYILLVIGLVAFFGTNTVPTENKDFVVSICTVLASGALMAVYTLIGKDPEELEKIKKENDVLRKQNQELVERVGHLENMFMDLQSRVINKLSEVPKQ